MGRDDHDHDHDDGQDEDDLRARLAAGDPLRGPLSDLPEPTDAEVRELAMSIVDHQRDTATSPTPRSPWARPRLAAAAAVLVAALAGAALWTGVGTDGSGAPAAAPQTMALDLPPSDVMGSCVQFDVAFLRDMPVAFAGTVTALDAESVTLRVDRWYTGGSADQVRIGVPPETSSASLDGVDFADGQRYLVAATDGVVNGCGFSGPATPQLEAAYAEAFGD